MFLRIFVSVLTGFFFRTQKDWSIVTLQKTHDKTCGFFIQRFIQGAFFVPNLLVLLAFWLGIPIPYSLGEYNFKLLSWKPSFLEVFLIAKSVPLNISAYGNFSLRSQQETSFPKLMQNSSLHSYLWKGSLHFDALHFLNQQQTNPNHPTPENERMSPPKKGTIGNTSSSRPIENFQGTCSLVFGVPTQGLSPHHPHPKERQVRYAALRPSPCGIPHQPWEVWGYHWEAPGVSIWRGQNS